MIANMCAARSNHLHVNFKLPQDQLFKIATADSYFRRSLELEVYPFAVNLAAIYQTIDASPKGFANRICQDPRDKNHLAALAATWKVIRKSEEQLQDKNAVVAQSYVSYSGHFSVSAARVTGLTINHEIIQTEQIARLLLQSFPQGALLISPEWMTRLDSENDKLTFIKENADRITTASKECFEKAGELKNCGVLFGFSALVQIRDVVTQQIDGRFIQTVFVAPTDSHVLEGINLWMFEWNPANPNEAIFCNALMGSSPVCLATAFINTEMERDLMRTMWQTVAYFQKAQNAGFHLEDWLAKEAPAILRRRRIYQGFEFFSQRAVEMRKVIGGNVVAPNVSVKEYIDTFESNEDRFKRLIVESDFVEMLPNADRPPGFTVNVEPVTADNFLFFREWDRPLGSSLDKLSLEELGMMKDQVKSYCKTKMTKELLDKIQEVLNPLYDAHVDPHQIEDYERKYAIIESTTNLNLVAKEILYNLLLTDAVTAVADKLDEYFPRFSTLDMRAIVSWVATYTVFLPLMRPQGLIVQWGFQRIRHLCISTLTAVTMTPSPDAQLSKLAEDIFQHRQAVEEIRMKIQSAGKTDLVQLTYQEELEIEEKILEGMMNKKAGLETVREELNSPDSISRRQRKVEQEVKKKTMNEVLESAFEE